MSGPSFLAVDLGASGGRVVRGRLQRNRLTTAVVHRFPNGGVALPDGLYWDVLRIYAEVVTGAARALEEGRLVSLGVDSWGVDYGLLGPAGELLANPRHYRDARTLGMLEQAAETFTREQIYGWTGVQFQRFNTLYQLLAERAERPWLLEKAERLLMFGELMAYLLTGRAAAEFTNATTSQLFDPRRGAWVRELFAGYGLPMELMPDVVAPGTGLGPVVGPAAERLGRRVEVVLPAVHDTAAAVAAVPGEGDDWCYISSGTWSLVGVELAEPVLTRRALAYNFTNEGGVERTVRFLRNVMGLWLLEESRNAWKRRGLSLDYDAILAAVQEAPPLAAIIDPDEPRFFSPGDLPGRIEDFCRETNQEPPQGVGPTARCIFESLALAYAAAVDQLEEVTGRSIRRIHVVGGGARNALLNRMTAAASRRPVIAGPVEATSVGNLLVQAMAAGLVADRAAGRALVLRSFPVTRIEPEPTVDWAEARERFAAFKRGDSG